MIHDLCIVQSRAKTHGAFAETARITQAIRAALHSSSNWGFLSSEQKEALDMMAVKQARIVSGDPAFPDHWDDIQGYAILGKG